jgi:hypothetical protein
VSVPVGGNMEGGGLLVVRGRFSGIGTFTFNGLILVIGAGDLDLSGLNVGIHGGLYVVNVTENSGIVTFGSPQITLSGNSDIIIDTEAIRMGVRQIPAVQLSRREITSSMDPLP